MCHKACLLGEAGSPIMGSRSTARTREMQLLAPEKVRPTVPYRMCCPGGGSNQQLQCLHTVWKLGRCSQGRLLLWGYAGLGFYACQHTRSSHRHTKMKTGDAQGSWSIEAATKWWLTCGLPTSQSFKGRIRNRTPKLPLGRLKHRAAGGAGTELHTERPFLL